MLPGRKQTIHDVENAPHGKKKTTHLPEQHTINMAPKKKGNKKGGDDWEAELGESIAPVDAGATPAAEAGEADDEPSAGGGGLMNLMRKNKEKRKKKGLVDEDEAAETAADAVPETLTLPDLSAKAPEEANLEDEFALPEKKGKGGKGKQQYQQKGGAAAAKDEDADDSGRVLTKAEKEKLKKEREKQRKKEQVGLFAEAYKLLRPANVVFLSITGCQEEGQWPSQSRAREGRRCRREGRYTRCYRRCR